MQLDKTRVEQEEKRKTLAAETQQHQQVGMEDKRKIYMLFASWEVRIVKNCDRALSRLHSPFFAIWTDP